MDKIKRLQNWINTAQSIVFFGGAGVSTESGIPDFRSADGLYHQKYDYPPEIILSHTFFMSQTEEFYRFYRDKMINLDAKPNSAHTALTKLEKIGKLKGIITQNIDGLHQMAGSQNVLELHGSIHRNYCMECHKKYAVDSILHSTGIPYCTCGGIIKPDVVLYEEALDENVLTNAVALITSADILIVGGTSLAVYPAAGLLDYYQKDKLVLINRNATPRDLFANLLIQDSIGTVFERMNF